MPEYWTQPGMPAPVIAVWVLVDVAGTLGVTSVLLTGQLVGLTAAALAAAALLMARPSGFAGG
jgi:hypothetical protein